MFVSSVKQVPEPDMGPERTGHGAVGTSPFHLSQRYAVGWHIQINNDCVSNLFLFYSTSGDHHWIMFNFTVVLGNKKRNTDIIVIDLSMLVLLIYVFVLNLINDDKQDVNLYVKHNIKCPIIHIPTTNEDIYLFNGSFAISYYCLFIFVNTVLILTESVTQTYH